MINWIARPERHSESNRRCVDSGECRLLAGIRRQLADENCVRQAAEHRRQAACASQAKETAPGNTGAVLSLILLVTAETELGKLRLSFLYPYPGHRLAVRPVGHIAHLAADPGIESARDVCRRHRLAVHPVRPVGHIAHLAAEPGIESARDVCYLRRRQPHR